MSNPNSYEVKLSVPFHDVDLMQVVWHGNYLKYFDIARFGLFNESGIDLSRYYEETNYLFPIIRTSTKYIYPLRHAEEFICRATIVEAYIKIVINFEIRRVKDNIICAKGMSEQIALKMPEREMMYEIPHDIRVRLEDNS